MVGCLAGLGGSGEGTQRLVSMPVAGKGLRSLVKQGGEEAKRDHSVMISDV